MFDSKLFLEGPMDTPAGESSAVRSEASDPVASDRTGRGNRGPAPSSAAEARGLRFEKGPRTTRAVRDRGLHLSTYIGALANHEAMAVAPRARQDIEQIPLFTVARNGWASETYLAPDVLSYPA